MRADFFNEAMVTAMLASSSCIGGETPQSDPSGEDLTRAEALRQRLNLLMDRADRTALQAGMPNDLVEAADFAACAFIDEALLSSASWSDRLDWLKNPLQFTRHRTATAGEDFYSLLDSLLEKVRETAPIATLPSTHDSGDTPPSQEAEACDPLHAVLEIFALCLAQGFTGMLYDRPEGIRDRLNTIGRFVPAVRNRAEPLFLTPPAKSGKQSSLRRVSGLLQRFDLLDWVLWIVPPVLTALLYHIFKAQLDQLLQPFLQGSAL